MNNINEISFIQVSVTANQRSPNNLCKRKPLAERVNKKLITENLDCFCPKGRLHQSSILKGYISLNYIVENGLDSV